MKQLEVYSDWDYVDGKKHLLAGRFNEAIECMNRTVKTNPRNSYGWYNRALAWKGLENHDQALADLNRAITLNSIQQFYAERALLLADMKQFDKALEDCRFVKETFVDSSEVQQLFAKVYMAKGDFSEALQCLSTAVELNRADASNWYLQGLCHERMEQTEAALADYSKAIEIDGNLSAALISRGELYLGRREFAKALADFNRVHPVGGSSGKTYYNRYLAYKGLGRTKDAESQLALAKSFGYKPEISR